MARKQHHYPTDPIQHGKDINKIKHRLKDSPRDFALFTLGLR